MLKNPYDIVIIFAIIALVVVTVGFGIESVDELGANVGNTQNQEFFTNVASDVNASTGLKGTSDEATDVIDPTDNPLTAEATEEGIITQGLQSLRSIGGTYKSVEKVMKDGTGQIGINPIYWTVIASTLIIIMFVLIYTWARGR